MSVAAPLTWVERVHDVAVSWDRNVVCAGVVWCQRHADGHAVVPYPVYNTWGRELSVECFPSHARLTVADNCSLVGVDAYRGRALFVTDRFRKNDADARWDQKAKDIASVTLCCGRACAETAHALRPMVFVASGNVLKVTVDAAGFMGVIASSNLIILAPHQTVLSTGIHVDVATPCRSIRGCGLLKFAVCKTVTVNANGVGFCVDVELHLPTTIWRVTLVVSRNEAPPRLRDTPCAESSSRAVPCMDVDGLSVVMDLFTPTRLDDFMDIHVNYTVLLQSSARKRDFPIPVGTVFAPVPSQRIDDGGDQAFAMLSNTGVVRVFVKLVLRFTWLRAVFAFASCARVAEAASNPSSSIRVASSDTPDLCL